jgi:hypothetical protein
VVAWARSHGLHSWALAAWRGRLHGTTGDIPDDAGSGGPTPWWWRDGSRRVEGERLVAEGELRKSSGKQPLFDAESARWSTRVREGVLSLDGFITERRSAICASLGLRLTYHVDQDLMEVEARHDARTQVCVSDVESHEPALTELDVNVSAQSAPTVQSWGSTPSSVGQRAKPMSSDARQPPRRSPEMAVQPLAIPHGPTKSAGR